MRQVFSFFQRAISGILQSTTGPRPSYRPQLMRLEERDVPSGMGIPEFVTTESSLDQFMRNEVIRSEVIVDQSTGPVEEIRDGGATRAIYQFRDTTYRVTLRDGRVGTFRDLEDTKTYVGTDSSKTAMLTTVGSFDRLEVGGMVMSEELGLVSRHDGHVDPDGTGHATSTMETTVRDKVWVGFLTTVDILDHVYTAFNGGAGVLGRHEETSFNGGDAFYADTVFAGYFQNGSGPFYDLVFQDRGQRRDV